MPNLPLVAVAGPTGAGKSTLALLLAEHFSGEIVNFDSVQVYAGFDVGSAKVPPPLQRGIPHHLIDLCSPTDLFTAGDFATEVRVILPQIIGRRRLPILCGGTGFYLRALLQGLSPGPSRDDDLRDSLSTREARHPGAIRRLLERLDPEAAGRIHSNDANKSIRALELRLLAGRSGQEHFSNAGLAPLTGYDTLVLALNPPREELYKRLSQRCEEMWHGGLIGEVKHLLDAGVSPSAKPFESLGYRQALRYLVDPDCSESEALEEMKVRTRQYAKRQWTWFRGEKDAVWIDGFGSDKSAQDQVVTIVAEFLKKCCAGPEHFLD
ncbi:MAG: tRNA (adenosine(37)-N6)-dimethylallyltransferase MiaA [Acidobacteria bacterium]|nr:tRNA (adenosine(37)-N6)-dimethylallyltransferase MiaA [Acidobacteriota bacterium]